MPPNCLNSSALPSITGSAAVGPMSPRPEHGGAVGDDGDGVRLPGVVVGQVDGSSAMAVQTRATPGV